ncbi:LacI family DNA-binding transcriptional regulator [Ruania zhangjianzhongii]|uniref:LacI family DNA-binding transcriptional regulator n=1 Tax=Ruania zhangjianzhongii TaxID=2603206 RepID=UPI001AEF5703|nr:LacI family DNA-binding transcriptional regulator [Ruania zhangjianzhongii]
MPSVTLSDVAREAGVSLATASRAINGSANRTVRPELRERVLAAAGRLGYSPDANAQAMARGRTTTLGLIVHDIADPYFSSIAAGVSAAAEDEGLMVTLASTAHRPERETVLLEMLQSQRARAIVIAGGRQDDPEGTEALRIAVAAYAERGGTVAMIAQPILDVNTVAIDNTGGAAALAQALVGIGYREFAILTGPGRHLTGAERTTGFAAALTEAGLPEPHLVECEFTRDGGYAGMAELLRSGPKVQAVFAVNDVMAMGAMAAARDAGLTVGADIGVAGFDDIHTLRDVTPGLSTVAVPLPEVGRLATHLALQPSSEKPLVEQVQVEVVLRDSTPPLT